MARVSKKKSATDILVAVAAVLAIMGIGYFVVIDGFDVAVPNPVIHQIDSSAVIQHEDSTPTDTLTIDEQIEVMNVVEEQAKLDSGENSH